MSPVWGHAVGVVIVLLLLLFSGILRWAWAPFHKNAFDALARLPMHDGDDLDPTSEDNQR
jgi:cytochrome c oxidase cbb3-type subunit IV